jgi:hypothetical protein
MRTLSITVTLLLFSAALFAQQKKRTAANQSVSHNIKLGVNTFFDTDEFPFYINWEAKVGNSESIQIGILPRISKYNDDNTSGIGVSAAFRKYISKNRSGISGLFISPIIKVGFLNDKSSYSSYNYGSNPPQYYTAVSSSKLRQYNVGFVFGHNWVFKSGFSFEASGGFGYYNTTEKSSSNSLNIGNYNYRYKYSGILPQVQINFGYAF